MGCTESIVLALTWSHAAHLKQSFSFIKTLKDISNTQILAPDESATEQCSDFGAPTNGAPMLHLLYHSKARSIEIHLLSDPTQRGQAAKSLTKGLTDI